MSQFTDLWTSQVWLLDCIICAQPNQTNCFLEFTNYVKTLWEMHKWLLQSTQAIIKYQQERGTPSSYHEMWDIHHLWSTIRAASAHCHVDNLFLDSSCMRLCRLLGGCCGCVLLNRWAGKLGFGLDRFLSDWVLHFIFTIDMLDHLVHRQVSGRRINKNNQYSHHYHHQKLSQQEGKPPVHHCHWTLQSDCLCRCILVK